MAWSIIALVLLAAVLHASWNALAKKGGDPLFSIASYQLFGTGVVLFALPFVPLPAKESWWAIGASLAIHTVYYFTAAGSLRNGDLSQIYPLYRGLSPILIAISAAVFAGESLSHGELLGIGLVSIALMSLAWNPDTLGRLSSTALKWGLATSVLIAAYTVVDGMGVRQAGNPYSYILWLFALEGIPVGLYVMIFRRKPFTQFFVSNWKIGLFGGVISSTAYGLVIFAMGLGSMALVSSVRETSILFAAIIGTVFLKEAFGMRRIVAAVFVTLGIIIIRTVNA